MFSFPDASRFLGVEVELPNPSLFIHGASIDTRTLQPGNLFVALSGTRVDGHRFIEEAFRKGACGALIGEKVFESDRPSFSRFWNLLPVRDPAEALAVLAAGYRSFFDLKTVGITGSVGKTTTKEFLRYVLGRKHSTLATEGNLNNHLGLPLTLLRLERDHRFCVAELGANHSGEIRSLAGVLKPTAALITQVAPAHLEGFGSLEAVYNAKLELFEVLGPGAPVVIPDDDPVLIERAKKLKLKTVTVGYLNHADYQISGADVSDGYVFFNLNKKRRFAFPGSALFLARNAGMAIAMAETLGLSTDEISEIWKDLKLPAGRFEEQVLANGIRVVFDGYNANPKSFAAAIETFCALPVSGKRVLVFSDMLELGKYEKKYHEDLGLSIAHSHLDYVASYGERSRITAETIRANQPSLHVDYFKDPCDVAHALSRYAEAGDAILFKASRGMKIEEVLKSLKQIWQLEDSGILRENCSG